MPPPVVTLEQTLPFDALAWENFERLCLRLARARGDVAHATDHAGGDTATGRMSTRQSRAQGRLYGTRGQKQQGIDLYVRLPMPLLEGQEPERRRYLTLQSRRIANVTATQLKKAVSDFLAGRWAELSRIFVYATSLPDVRTQLADEIERQTARLARNGIEFEVWDADVLTDQLRENIQLVYDFFGRALLDAFAGPEAANALGRRLDAGQVGALRRQLADHYRVIFGNTDSGMVALRRADAPRLNLAERYVIPDVTATSPTEAYATSMGMRALMAPEAAAASKADDGSSALTVYQETRAAMFGRGSYAQWRGFSAGVDASPFATTSNGELASIAGQLTGPWAFVRSNADSWLASADRHVVIGDPGSGKSTLLRYMVLDLLSDNPTMLGCAERFGDRLPIWLPFHFFTRRRADYTGAEASLQSTLRAWLEQNDAPDLWALVEKALDDERLLLVIDGLDEWVSEQAGQTAATAIENFIGERHLPAVASTRPYGLERLRLASQWQYAQLAPLSDDQQRALALLWFRAAADQTPSTASRHNSPQQVEARQWAAVLTKQVENFLRDLRGREELGALAGVPLFLLLLIGLHLAGVALPGRRFDLYQLVADMLLRDHPATRATSAAIANERPVLREADVRAVLGRVAFGLQQRGDIGAVDRDTIRRDVIDALRDEDHLAMAAAEAARVAGDIVDLAEGELGVLVRQGPREIGFLHRVLQEQLAAEYIADRLPISQQQKLLDQRAADPRWKEVLLAMFWRLTRPTELRELIGALAKRANDEEPSGLEVRELLADVISGGYRLPAPEARSHARAILDVIETHPYLPHRQRLLSACIPGLGSPAVRPELLHRLPRWLNPMPAVVPRIMADLPDDDSLAVSVRPILKGELASEDLSVALAAARTLADRYSGTGQSADVRNELTERAQRAPTAGHMATALYGLFLGWIEDEPVRDLVARARGQHVRSVRLVAFGAVSGVLRGTVTVGQSRSQSVPELPRLDNGERQWLIDQLSAERSTEQIWQPLLIDTLLAATRDDTALSATVRDTCLAILRGQHTVLGDRELAMAVLLLGHATDPAVISYICNGLRTERFFPVLTDVSLLVAAYSGNTLVASAVEDSLQTFPDARMDRDLYFLAAIDRGPVMRTNLLKGLSAGGFPHWAAGALAEHWADDGEVMSSLRAVLEGEPVRASQVAPAAPRALGPDATITRMLTLLTEAERDDNISRHFRFDFVVSAIAEAWQLLGNTNRARAEEIAGRCFEAFNRPRYGLFGEIDTDAEAEIVAAFPDTSIAHERLPTLLDRPRPPLAALLAAYAGDSVTLGPILGRVTATQPTLPAALRAHLCLVLRDRTTDSSLIRQLTRQWPDESGDLVRSAASAAFHTHLARSRDIGDLDPPEWENARTVLRSQARAYGLNYEGRRRAAWLGTLLTGEFAILDDLFERDRPDQPAQVPLGSPLDGPDLLLLTELADRWPALLTHFGQNLVSRLAGNRIRDTSGSAWEYLALIAAGQPPLSRDLENSVAADPALLDHDGVLAWYATTHRNDASLLDVLLARLDRQHTTNARSLATILLSDPWALGLDAEELLTRLRARIRAELYSLSPPLEVLADAFPDDQIVHDVWAARNRAVASGATMPLHPRTYFPLAYAAIPASGFLNQLAKDIAWLSAGGTDYFDPQFARAVVRRIRRDAEARAQVATAITDGHTSDAWATQLASYLTVARSLNHDLTSSLTTRYRRQHLAALPDTIRDRVSAADVPVPVALLRVLDSAAADPGVP